MSTTLVVDALFCFVDNVVVSVHHIYAQASIVYLVRTFQWAQSQEPLQSKCQCLHHCQCLYFNIMSCLLFI